jgi:hypothetical protein
LPRFARNGNPSRGRQGRGEVTAGDNPHGARIEQCKKWAKTK